MLSSGSSNSAWMRIFQSQWDIISWPVPADGAGVERALDAGRQQPEGCQALFVTDGTNNKGVDEGAGVDGQAEQHEGKQQG